MITGIARTENEPQFLYTLYKDVTVWNLETNPIKVLYRMFNYYFNSLSFFFFIYIYICVCVCVCVQRVGLILNKKKFKCTIEFGSWVVAALDDDIIVSGRAPTTSYFLKLKVYFSEILRTIMYF